MSVKTHHSVPIGERKTDNFLLRLSKQSQEKIGAASQAATNDGQSIRINSGFQKPQRPLYTSVNTENALKPTKPAFLSSLSREVDQSTANNDNVLSATTVSPNALLRAANKASNPPMPPSKPQKLSHGTSLCSIPALKPLNSETPYSESRQLEHIKVELPTYVARKQNAKVSYLRNDDGCVDVGRPEEGKNTSLHNQGPPKPPKIPLKPAFASNHGSVNPIRANVSHAPVATGKIVPLKPLKPKTLAPPRNQEVIETKNETNDNQLTSSYKPRFKPIVLNKPVPSAEPATISSAPYNEHPLSVKPKVASKPKTFSRPNALADVKSVPPNNPKHSLDQKSAALPDFKATLSLVIRSQTEPLLSKRAIPGKIIRAQTVTECSSNNSESSKLTHPNKNRSKGPKRRLPKGDSKSKLDKTQKQSFPAENFSTPHKPSIEAPQTSMPLNELHSHVKSLQPIEKRAPPPKGKKPDFKHLAIPSNT